MAKKKNSPAPEESPKKPAVPLVAIGASAGGLEAVSELLQHLSPTTGLAYVYIQHLDPNHDSHLANILSRTTPMPVVQAEHLMKVEPNHVYIIPPDKEMESVDGVLTLTPRPRTGNLGEPSDLSRSDGSPRLPVHMPVDRFFISLANRQKEGAVGVVLSGMASDGTLGLRAIKAAGGLTFAQDGSAQFQSMPKAAIVEGVVDQVLSPAQIAQALEQLSQQPDIFQQTELAEAEEQTGDSEEDLQTIIQFIRRATGVDFTHYKMTTIRRRIIRRMLLYRLETLGEYAQYLRRNAGEIGMLYNDLLINVTTFFRDEDTMDYLRKVLLPRLVKEKKPGTLFRIWVPACSTGQEAYSLAMLLLEVLGEQANGPTVQIFATDLSEPAVARARHGSYTRSEVADVSPRRLHRFFTKVDDHYRINKVVRDLCVFAPQNILRDPPFSRLDLISCRNLLIYLDAQLQQRAIATFHYALNPNGCLVLGKSETVGSAATLFSQVEKNYKVYARRNDQSTGGITNRINFDPTARVGVVRLEAGSPPEADPLPAPGSAYRVRSATHPKSNSANDLDKTVDELLLRQYVPASVVVNQDLDILQFRGSTGLFLEPAPGKASLNLLKMARPSLAFEIRNTVHKAGKAGGPVRKAGLEVRLKDQVHYVAIEAVPLSTSAEEPLFLVLFEEVTPQFSAGADATDAGNRRIRQLEEELATLREDMRSVIEAQEASNEELQSANEEIISSNEELQSINEELETGQEEIESTNEELLTINQELQVRNDQLSDANEFSDIVLATIREATLVLDEDLRVRSANKTFYDLFQVGEDQTEGWLIYELGSRQWDIPQLRLLLTDVITHNVQVDEYEVIHTFELIGEKVLRLNARRVVRQQASILLVIEDITDHRRSQRLLAEREAWLHALVDNAPVLIWVANAEGRYTFFNQVWLTYTNQSLQESITLGWEAGIHSDDRESYLTMSQAAIARHEPYQAEFRLKRHDNEYHWMLINAKPTYTLDGRFDGYIGTCAEIYNRKTLLQALDIRAQQRTQQVMEASTRLLRAQDELARANAKLKRDEAELRTGRYELTFETGALRLSDAMYRLLGYEPNAFEPTLDQLYARMLPDDIPLIRQRLTQVRQDQQSFSMTWHVYTSEGDLRHILTRNEVVADETGQFVQLLGTALNVTAQKLAEDKLRQGEDQLRALIENTPDIITRWDMNLRLIYANPALESKTGVANAQLLGKTNGEMGQPDEIAGPYMDKLRLVIQTGTPQSHYYSFPTPKGLAYFYSSMLPERGNDGAVQTVLVIARDITDLKLVEEIQVTANNLQAVLNASPASIGLLRAVRNEQYQVVDFRVVVCNHKFAYLVERPMDQMPGCSAADLTSALWEGETYAVLANVLTTGEPTYKERLVSLNGEERWIGMSVSRHDDGVVLSGMDITVLKQSEQQQDTLLGQIERSQQTVHELDQIRRQVRERGEFLRQTSHDLRGSFGVIQGAAQLLDLSDTDEERAQMLSMLQRNLRQMTQMIGQLLDFSRLEAGQEAIEAAPFDAAELLRELSVSVQPVADERHLTFQTAGPASLPVVGDAVKVRRIAQNLVLNALKYSSSGSVILRWQADGAGWCLGVDDTGPGLSPALVSQLNDPSDIGMVPASAGTGRSDGLGEGIGLSIVKRLIVLLGARLSVESTANVGTHFRVSFS